MILVDTTVLMYAAGTDHPHRAPSIRFLEAAALGEIEAAVDAEVLQEILHRYRAIGRWEQGRVLYDATRRLLTDVFPISAEVTDRARHILSVTEGVSARDAIHAAVVALEGLEGICSFDRGFDRIPDIRRLEPSFILA